TGIHTILPGISTSAPEKVRAGDGRAHSSFPTGFGLSLTTWRRSKERRIWADASGKLVRRGQPLNIGRGFAGVSGSEDLSISQACCSDGLDLNHCPRSRFRNSLRQHVRRRNTSPEERLLAIRSRWAAHASFKICQARTTRACSHV